MPGSELVRQPPGADRLNGEAMRLIPTCKEVHQLTSEGMDRRLTAFERLRIRLHLSMCDACTAFSAQMKLIRGAMRRLRGSDFPSD